MKPSVVLLGALLGTACSITFSLIGVAVVFLVLGPRYPRLEAEADSLLVNLGFFGLLTLFAALSFYGALKEHPLRHVTLVPLFVTLAVIVWYYWPE